MALINAPVIPTEITVHLGTPNSASENITVPFVEYIKNVASNEIYPTWPLDALKANILAIISFALNRIYNEWYYSQGYDFDITSSSLYDQTFVENSQFFETISDVVDDIFNNYIVKEDQVQPLFASYCDGRVTTCDGLSQWGSVTLAKNGKSPLEILKYYYGDNIRIVYNAPVSASIMSYPGTPLSLGSAGNAVKTLKIQLNRISQNYPAIPSITDNNYFFTKETEDAVLKFQNIFNLSENGIVDKATWYKIKYIYNAVKKISDLYSEGISIEEAELAFSTTLEKGSTGVAVNTLNYLLNVIAFFDPDIPLLSLNDTYDENTEQMVRAFQNKYNLSPTGIVDTATWNKIVEVYKQTIENIPTEYLVYKDEFFPGIILLKGMSGNNIVRLQNFLLQICKKTHSIPGVVVNGIFDDLTEQSVIAIQKKYNLDPSGAVGTATWQRIVDLSKEE